jgi:2-oxoglutarate ferredoxin oxidoreductase subunit gamma
MTDKIIIAGFGGQGIVTLGEIMAFVGMRAGKNVTHFPSYGAEMRGGTANCAVIISDEEIYSPVFARPKVAIVMNEPSFIRFGPLVQKNGCLLVDSSHITGSSGRADLKVISAAVTNEADGLGNVRVANVIMLGLWAKIAGWFEPELVRRGIADFFAKKKKALVDLNVAAFDRGWSLAPG